MLTLLITIHILTSFIIIFIIINKKKNVEMSIHKTNINNENMSGNKNLNKFLLALVVIFFMSNIVIPIFFIKKNSIQSIIKKNNI